MVNLAQIASRREDILKLAEHYHASDVRVFGSVARSSASPDSDIDFLIKTQPGCTLFDLGGFHEDLEGMFQCRVDLVVEDGLKPRLRERILHEAILL